MEENTENIGQQRSLEDGDKLLAAGREGTSYEGHIRVDAWILITILLLLLLLINIVITMIIIVTHNNNTIIQ